MQSLLFGSILICRRNAGLALCCRERLKLKKRQGGCPDEAWTNGPDSSYTCLSHQGEVCRRSGWKYLLGNIGEMAKRRIDDYRIRKCQTCLTCAKLIWFVICNFGLHTQSASLTFLVGGFLSATTPWREDNPKKYTPSSYFNLKSVQNMTEDMFTTKAKWFPLVDWWSN